jgi:hypothetical protein
LRLAPGGFSGQDFAVIRQSFPLISPADADAWRPRWHTLAICLTLAAITFAVFGQTLGHQFVNFDDDLYVYNNPMVARGLTWDGFVQAFTQVHSVNWTSSH